VRQGRSSRCVPRIQSLVRKELNLYHASSGCYSFSGLVVSTQGPDCDH
jgi:hypothetical protein